MPIFAKGANLVPLRVVHSQMTKGVVADTIDYALATNMNMIRIWGGGTYQVCGTRCDTNESFCSRQTDADCLRSLWRLCAVMWTLPAEQSPSSKHHRQPQEEQQSVQCAINQA